MRKSILAGTVLALAVPVAPAVAESTPATPSAQEQCQQLRTQLGAKTFAETYGTNKNRANAFGKCVSRISSEQSKAGENAAKQCRAEQAADAAAFTAKYGTGKRGANAFGKCVSSKRSTATRELRTATVNAARTCKAERKADPAAFKAKYGTNASKSNAFGKCVSTKAKAAQQS